MLCTVYIPNCYFLFSGFNIELSLHNEYTAPPTSLLNSDESIVARYLVSVDMKHQIYLNQRSDF